MKILLSNPSNKSKRKEEGLATFVFIALLAILLLLVTANSMELIHLHHEVRFLEQQQVKRLDGCATNSAASEVKNVDLNQK